LPLPLRLSSSRLDVSKGSLRCLLLLHLRRCGHARQTCIRLELVLLRRERRRCTLPCWGLSRRLCDLPLGSATFVLQRRLSRRTASLRDISDALQRSLFSWTASVHPRRNSICDVWSGNRADKTKAAA
jgi:hypothetical protein